MKDYIRPLKHKQIERAFSERIEILHSSQEDKRKLFEDVIGNYISYLNKGELVSHSFFRGNGYSLNHYIQRTSEFLGRSIQASERIIKYIQTRGFDFTDEKKEPGTLKRLELQKYNKRKPELGFRIGLIEDEWVVF
jgi:hypothetical protein